MLLTTPLLLALFAPASSDAAPSKTDETAKPPAAEPEDDEQAAADADAAQDAEAAAPTDPSSDPDLDVPGLEDAVLPTEAQSDLHSLNPSEPVKEEAEKPAEDQPQDPEAANQQEASATAPPKRAKEPEFRYHQAKETQETYVWADAPKGASDYRYADAGADPSASPYTFAPSEQTSQDPVNPPSFLRSKYRKPSKSKQRFGLHFKMGPYLPDIDKGDPQGPYAKIFGEVNQANVVTKAPEQKLIYWLGFEWQFYHLAGPLSVGLDLGFFTDSADARIADPASAGLSPIAPELPAFTTSADRNQFTFIPLALLAGYRFSYLADKTPVPLAPYARAGLNYNFWWAQQAAGSLVRDPEGTAVRGGILGWQAQFGLALHLDGIFRRAGRHMDYRYGINHVSLFGEFAISKSGLGGKKINLGDNTFYGGLLLEF